MSFLPPNQQRQSTEGYYRTLIGNRVLEVEPTAQRGRTLRPPEVAETGPCGHTALPSTDLFGSVNRASDRVSER